MGRLSSLLMCACGHLAVMHVAGQCAGLTIDARNCACTWSEHDVLDAGIQHMSGTARLEYIDLQPAAQNDYA